MVVDLPSLLKIDKDLAETVQKCMKEICHVIFFKKVWDKNIFLIRCQLFRGRGAFLLKIFSMRDKKLSLDNNEFLAVMCPLYRGLKYGFDRGSIYSSKNSLL